MQLNTSRRLIHLLAVAASMFNYFNFEDQYIRNGQKLWVDLYYYQNLLITIGYIIEKDCLFVFLTFSAADLDKLLDQLEDFLTLVRQRLPFTI